MKLIVTDIDNTLLRSDKSISEYTARVFERARSCGYLTAFATARAEGTLTSLAERLKASIIVANGGAVINVDGKRIHESFMSQKDVSTIIKMSLAFTNGKGLMTAHCNDGYYCNFEPSDPSRRAAYTYSDFGSFEKATYKISAEIEEDEQAKEIERACSDVALINYSGEKWRQFAPSDANKGSALLKLVSYLGMDLCDVIAFGDDINDLGMLRLAGTAVAVSNAIEEVKAAADYVADSNDNDGVAKYLDSIMKGCKK
jgi:Cof subfamily protein (haloacid dehalogenase superfamily)